MMKNNTSHIIVLIICSVISLPCLAIFTTPQKQMSTAQTSQHMAQVIQNATNRTANSKWIELNIDKLMNQIEKEIRNDQFATADEMQQLHMTINATTRALERMPKKKGKKLAEKLDTSFKSLQLKILKEQWAEQRNITPITEEIEAEEPIKTVTREEYDRLLDSYRSWQADDDAELPAGITSEQFQQFRTEIREIRETQMGDTRQISKETYNFLKMLPNATRIPV
ncbi:MAG TPA: hypothetical protein VGT41_04755 [Candidatus Babeliales bacterium]|nr:hypothetical protein [Candidatus Babeliales bacterium]